MLKDLHIINSVSSLLPLLVLFYDRKGGSVCHNTVLVTCEIGILKCPFYTHVAILLI